MRSSTSFFSCYQEPLLPSNIRLPRLYPDKPLATPVRCELFHYSLEHAGDSAHPYDALSYVWGDPSNPKAIFVENRESTSFQELSVTRNLYSALLRLRHRFIERVFIIIMIAADPRPRARDFNRFPDWTSVSQTSLFSAHGLTLIWDWDWKEKEGHT
jgi:hypothetical protein